MKTHTDVYISGAEVERGVLGITRTTTFPHHHPGEKRAQKRLFILRKLKKAKSWSHILVNCSSTEQQ